jgi:hypothetical protein
MVHAIQTVSDAKLLSKEVADIFPAHAATTALALQLFDGLTKRFFLRFGKALGAPVMRHACQALHAATGKPLHPAHDGMARDTQGRSYFRTIFTFFQMRQRHQAQPASPIRFLARQSIPIDLLQLPQRFLRQHFRYSHCTLS